MKVHKYKFVIAFADTDAAGIVYHARFIEIAERARTDWLRNIMLADKDSGIVIKKLSVKYDIPLNLFDEIVVESFIANTGAASADIEQRFVRDGVVCAVLHIRVVFVDSKTLRPKRIPDMWLGLVDGFEQDLR